MRHPFTRAERRYARSLAQQRYNLRLPSGEENRLWNHGGKRCEAHGNRCAHSLIERQEHRRALKRLRRASIA